MQFVIVITLLIALTMADSYLYPVPLQQLQTPSFFVVVKNQQNAQLPAQQQQQVQQYFSQDALGQYSYGYSEPLSSKQEVHRLDGVTTGSYSYTDANGLLQTVDYTADDDGFHVVATNLPKASQTVPESVKETPEVAKAREEHLIAHKAILEGNRLASSILPKPVEDTPEVAQAKKEFFVRFAAEEKKQKLLRETALLKNQKSITSGQIRPISLNPNGKPTNLPCFKTSQVPGNGVISYGYQIGSVPVQASRYYLPVV